MRLVSNSHFKKPSSLRYLRSGALITEPFQSQQCIFFKVLFANLSTNLRTYLYYLIYRESFFSIMRWSSQEGWSNAIKPDGLYDGFDHAQPYLKTLLYSKNFLVICITFRNYTFNIFKLSWVNCIGLYITKSIWSVITDKDIGKCQFFSKIFRCWDKIKF